MTSTISRRPLLAGNWKMHGSTAEARAWARAAAGAAADNRNEVALFPPAPFLQLVLAEVDGAVSVGGQSCHTNTKGAFTGATSAAMLADLGCTYVLCGHSERRHIFGESDEFVAGAAAQAATHGLTPVLCVGEKIEEREAEDTQSVLSRQLTAALDVLPPAPHPLVIAYEPVWAIGTGKAATAEDAQAAHAFLRELVARRDPERAAGLRILYGGSVKPDNVAGYLACPDIDGALVGGASLDPAAFAEIATA